MFVNDKSGTAHNLSGELLSCESSLSIALTVAPTALLEASGSTPTSSWLELSSTALVGRAETKNWTILGRSRFLHCSSANRFFSFLKTSFKPAFHFIFIAFYNVNALLSRKRVNGPNLVRLESIPRPHSDVINDLFVGLRKTHQITQI